MDQTLSRSERETLKAMYRLTKAGSDTHTGALAEALRVSPGTATAAVKRLAERDLAHHRPYRGVELTTAGRQAAVAAIRRHRIVERFLSDMLGYPWNEADRLATPFGHEVREKHPFDGRLVIRVDGHDRTIGHRVANQIYVKIDERDAPPAPSRQHGQQHRKEQLA